MSVSRTYKTLRIGNTNDSYARPEMAAREGETAVEAKLNMNERNNGTKRECSRYDRGRNQSGP